jgi:hypothetical protein
MEGEAPRYLNQMEVLKFTWEGEGHKVGGSHDLIK